MKNSILKSTVLVFLLSLAGKGIGFLKSMIIASSFGASNVTDTYYMANGVISNIFYAVTTSVSVAFLPMYIKKKEEDGAEKSYQFSTRIVTGLGLISIFLTLILIVGAPFIVDIMASSFSDKAMMQTVAFLRIMAIGIVFSLMASVFQNILNAEKIYGYAAFSSIMNSLVLISMVLLFQKHMGIMALVVATPLSYLLQFLFLRFRCRFFVSVSVKYGIWDVGVGELLRQALPVLLSNTTIEINQLIDRMLLISIEEGAVTALSYSAVLFQFAAHVISLPISTITFTELSLACAQDDRERIRNLLNKTLRLIITICVPVLSVMFFASETIVSIVYGHGQFTPRAVVQAGEGLAFYAFCLMPYCLKQVVTQAFYSVRETKIPMILGILEVMANIVSSIVFSRFYGIAGVVMGTAFASTLFSIVLIVVFSWKKVNLGIHNMKYLFRLVIVAVIVFLIAEKCSIYFQTFWGLCMFSVLIFGAYAILLLIFRDTMVLEAIKKLTKLSNNE